jgi:hypothetical protein
MQFVYEDLDRIGTGRCRRCRFFDADPRFGCRLLRRWGQLLQLRAGTGNLLRSDALAEREQDQR